VDEVALIQNTISDYAPVLIGPLSIQIRRAGVQKNSSRSACFAISTEILWKWIDAHGKEFGIGRPYLDKDPPHVAPMDGKEYADKRGLNAKLAGKGRAATGRDAKVAKPPQTLPATSRT
jgi:hypothetical protein